MSLAAVVDTNVGVVANGDASQASADCFEQCCDRLLEITRGQVKLVLDDGFEIVGEYQRYMSRRGEPKFGDAFMKWVHDNQYNPAKCLQVSVKPHPNRGFEDFPDDPDLDGFDRSDRKFVAVALASNDNPQVWNAVDSDWWDFQDALGRHGLVVEHVCPDMVADWRLNRGRR